MEDLQKLSHVIFEDWLIFDHESFWGPDNFLSLCLPKSLISVTCSCITVKGPELHCLCQVNMNSSFNIEIDALTVCLSCSTLF